jgi:hypothetical protein
LFRESSHGLATTFPLFFRLFSTLNGSWTRCYHFFL